MDLMFESNDILDKLPKHLMQFVTTQDYEFYSPIDHAVWRYVMKKNVQYLSKYAHESYLTGLAKTGISMDHVPNMYGMNRILKEIGWAAVAVNGLIPTKAFLEFQAHNVLVIASDIRQKEDIEYTPSPDIIHESAGHAPIIANVEYAEFLRRIGEIGAKAISSSYDQELYEATRHLTNLKGSSGANDKELAEAEEKVKDLQHKEVEPSEMAKIRNLHWWSVEYGLIGELGEPKIYGAGLLSSIGESSWCMSDKVKKLPFTLETADYNFDYTKPQPQLFVTPNFAHLSYVLDELANSMALRRGGHKGLTKLIESKQLGTIELSTGLQISGLFSKILLNEEGKVAYFQTNGKTALAYHEKELLGHGITTHGHGFGSPIGKLKGINLAIEDMSPRDLEFYNIYEGRFVNLTFEGDITLAGEVITGKRTLKGKIILISFRNCTVKHKEVILFRPEYGIYDMAVGKKIVSAFSGPADPNSFDLTVPLSLPNIKIPKNKAQNKLENLYLAVKKIGSNSDELQTVFRQAQENFPDEWLLYLEILDAIKEENVKLKKEVIKHLNQIKFRNQKVAHLIEVGLNFS
jgi:phenylalanine-4-hydroxylase